MRVGSRIKNRSAGIFFNFVLTVFFICYSISVHAIDNPDAPDYIDAFQNRAQVYELNIRQAAAHTTQDYIAAYAAYEDFLDQELNSAYKQLMVQLSEEAQYALRSSQRKWLSYRNQEFDFIARNWTTAQFGSSSAISRGEYRTALIKNRVILLLQYLKNY
ncbi:lysozyme inhibitor LprI family protein [Nitrosomonas sp.]|uniref:lysozyme inhibitor LprI family protein n=1 Tax=Nitrosomonas sp. TaxID=42353 RepID=UPI0020859BC1|nr:lysozyme inhibitor LprI family protein [Nitrosomonas sp.]GJL74720.1 MAG: hypothetical protein NMNS02_08260 [Nitrosomonas sp.]